MEGHRKEATELWDAMRRSRAGFALIDPITHRFLDANDQFAALFELDVAELKRRTVMTLYPQEIASSIEQINGSFARGIQHLVRGRMPFRKPSGVAIELAGWSRRFDGMSDGPLIVTCAVEVGVVALPDDRYWVAQAPHLFGIANDDGGVEGSDPDDADAHFERLLESLTPQEMRVLDLLVGGFSDREIASKLNLADNTVRHHVSHLLRKLRKRRTQVIIQMLKRKPK